MKKLLLLNVSLLVYLAALFCAIAMGYSTGAVMVIIASVGMVMLYGILLRDVYRSGGLLQWEIFLLNVMLVVIGALFLQGYSVAIGHSLLSFPAFYNGHVLIGFSLLSIYVWYSVLLLKREENIQYREWVFIAIGIFGLMSFLGYLGMARILPGTVRLIYYGFVFLVWFNFIFFLISFFKSGVGQRKLNRIGLIISLFILIHWFIRWQLPEIFSAVGGRVVFNLAVTALVILPVAIFSFRRVHFLIIFIVNAILLDIYFLNYDRDFKMLTDTGWGGCVGYENEIQVPVVTYPGTSMDELLRSPSEEEIDKVRSEWLAKDFSPKGVRVEFKSMQPNGDSIKVISHLVHGQRHYGLIRIPSGVDLKKAPILLALNGGGADVDVLDVDYTYRIASGSCRNILSDYLVIAPSFRGDIVRGDGFCFRSEGYTGDVWAGAAEDAAYFLEAVKSIYHKENSPVLAMGISRGATVALILGGLTDKVDYIVSISTHADFFNKEAFEKEKVGGDYAKVFFTPQASPDSIRRRMLVSSPYYFAEHLPPFEIHQGTEDNLTTARHTLRLRDKLAGLNLMDSTARIFLYPGKAHGYDDDRIVCDRLSNFARRQQ